VRSQFIDRRTRYERAVVVYVSERGDALMADGDAGEEVRVVALAARWHSWDIIIINIVVIIQIRVAAFKIQENKLSKLGLSGCSGVLDVDELATPFAHHEVQVACASHNIVQSQHINQRTLSEHAVAVEVSERRGTEPADVAAVEGVRASRPYHKHRRRRRPGVLGVDELAIVIAHDEVQVACGSHKFVQSQLIDRRRSLSVPSPSRSPSAGAL
jgi:hypothetical protein